MQIISQFAPLPLAQPEKGTAVAMGFFDGIHIGHRAVIESAVQWAKEHDAAPAVFTFKLPIDVYKRQSNVSRARVSKSVMKHHPLRCKASGYDKNVRLPDAGPKRHRPPAVCRQHSQKTV